MWEPDSQVPHEYAALFCTDNFYSIVQKQTGTDRLTSLFYLHLLFWAHFHFWGHFPIFCRLIKSPIFVVTMSQIFSFFRDFYHNVEYQQQSSSRLVLCYLGIPQLWFVLSYSPVCHSRLYKLVRKPWLVKLLPFCENSSHFS